MKKIFMLIATLIIMISHLIFAQGWQWIDTGFPVFIFDMSFPLGQSDIGFAVGSDLSFEGNGIILKTTDGGSTWSNFTTAPIPGLRAVCFTSVDVGYVGGYQNFLVKTTDGGSNWIPIVINPKLWYFNNNESWENFNNIEFWDDNNGVIVSYPWAIYFTTDAGATWNQGGLGIKHTIEDVCYADSNTLYMASGDEVIYKSSNGGFSWTEVYSGIPQTFFLGVDFYNLNYGMVCGENGKVLVTTDGGTGWTESNTGGNGLIQGVHILDMGKAYVVGTTEQVYKTTDYGITWISDFNVVDTVAFYKIKFNENNTGLICGSQGKFLINTDYVVPVNVFVNAPMEYILKQNYPNPFNPSTRITYFVPKESYVSIKVYDFLGREVKTLANNFQTTGNYEIIFDASDLPSGTYFYSMIAEKFSDTKKMIVLK